MLDLLIILGKIVFFSFLLLGQRIARVVQKRTKLPSGGFVLITGGLGKTLALNLIKHGYCVIGTVRKLAHKIQLEKDVGSNGDSNNLYILQMDVNSIDSISNAFNEAKTIVGNEGLFALINNAGVSGFGSVEDMPLEEFEHIMNTNLLGTIKVTRLFLPLLRQCSKGCAHIYTMSSPAGWSGRTLLSGYSCSKFAMEGLSDCLRKELRNQNIAVTKIVPAALKSNMVDNALLLAQKYREKCERENSPYVEVAKRAEAFIGRTWSGAAVLPPEEIINPLLRSLEQNDPPEQILTSKAFLPWILSKFPSKISDHFLL